MRSPLMRVQGGCWIKYLKIKEYDEYFAVAVRWHRLVVMLVRGHEGTFGSPIWNPINRRLHGLQNALQILLAPIAIIYEVRRTLDGAFRGVVVERESVDKVTEFHECRDTRPVRYRFIEKFHAHPQRFEEVWRLRGNPGREGGAGSQGWHLNNAWSELISGLLVYGSSQLLLLIFGDFCGRKLKDDKFWQAIPKMSV